MEVPGFRFYPTEEELVSFYLPNKIEGTKEEVMNRVIPELNIYDFSPWDLPQFSGALCQGDPEQCFFFIPRQESEARGGRPSRLTEGGYWKATGSPSYVFSSNNKVIGLKRTMVFYTGRAPHGTKTQWKMNEYKAIQGDQSSSSTGASTSTSTPKLRQEFSLCRVYKKTKCLRAFDRRPTGIEIITSDPTINLQRAPSHGDRPEEALMLPRQSPPPVAVERASSHEDSSSSEGGGGSGGQPSSQIGRSDDYLNLQMDTDGLWDWDDHFF